MLELLYLEFNGDANIGTAVEREKSARNGVLRTFRSKLMTTLKNKDHKTPRTVIPVTRMVEEIIGCKWSLSILALIGGGVHRPGAMQRRVQGLTAKVLNERLRKLLRFGIIAREVFAEVPPRVEYRLTPFGKRFQGILEQIAALDAER